jgi:serine/threonine-protein kinase
MQSAIPLGTVLQHRYRIIGILGQGGFGRTYLAEDQGRFNERCALKEFIPAQAGTFALEKSKELFRREAQVLYQIRHPQIPEFAAVFEENQRLFLVQDFVEGKTYHTLLQARQQSPAGQPKTFSENEILRFLGQMLPVLDYIHNLGIIHRDISPDNIILRQSDGQPVLIDFGVVNEIATRIQTNFTQPSATRVGKLGYAPVEQLQTGQVAPSSDLYALAVTAIVLLTGLEPQKLLDQTTLQWNWQPWANVRPALAQILNRMLAQQQSDRYPSAKAVEQALQQLTLAPATLNPAAPNWSEMKTLPVGRPAGVTQPTPSFSSASQVQSLNRLGIWERPGVIFTVTLIVMFLAGWGSWALVRQWLQSEPKTTLQTPSEPDRLILPTLPPEPTPDTPFTPEPIPEPTFTPEPTPVTPVDEVVPTPEPTARSRRLNVMVNQPLSRQGRLRDRDATENYRFEAETGQQLYLSVEGGVLLALMGPDQTLLTSPTNEWQGTLPNNGDYTIQLQPLPGREKNEYTLNVHLINSLDPVIPPSVPDPEPEVIPEPQPEPLPEPTPELTPEPTPEPVGESENPSDSIPEESNPSSSKPPKINEVPNPAQPSDSTTEDIPLSKPDTPDKSLSSGEPESTPSPPPPVSEREQPATDPITEEKGELLELLEQENQGNWEIVEPSSAGQVGG